MALRAGAPVDGTRMAGDVRLGSVWGNAPDGTPWKVAVAVVSEVNYEGDPRVCLSVGPRPAGRAREREDDGSWTVRTSFDDWFLVEDEVGALRAWLGDAAGLAPRRGEGARETEEVGALSGRHPSWHRWLSVALAHRDAARPAATVVRVRFEDQMLRDEGRENVVDLSPRSARALARLLERALRLAARQPARILRAEGAE